MFRFILFTVCLISVAISIGCGSKTSGLSADDQAQIYAVVIRQRATVDDTFGGKLKPSKIFIIRSTDDSASNPREQSTSSIVISTSIQDRITDLLRDLPGEIVWIDSFEDADFVEGIGPIKDVRNGAIFRLGNIKLQSDGSVHLSNSIYIASLASGGSTYVLEKTDGFWEITGTTGDIWMS